MKKYKNHNEHLSEEAIAKYLQKILSSEQMYAIEKHLLSCEFCNDAVEGFEAFGEIDIVQVSAELQDKLIQRTAKKIGYYRLGIAASIALLLTFSIFFLFDVMDESEEGIALSTEKKRNVVELNASGWEDSLEASNPENKMQNELEEPIVEISESESIEDKLVEEIIKENSNIVLQEKQKAIAETNNKAILDENYIALADEALIEEVVFDIESEEENELAMSPTNRSSEYNSVLRKSFPVKSKISEQVLSNTSDYSNARTAKPLNQEQKESVKTKTLSGTVYDESGQTLTGVNVVIKGSTIGTTTDIDGNYSLAEAEANDELIFSFIGMETLAVYVGNNEVIDVSLLADASEVSEVIVESEGIRRNKNALGYTNSEANNKSRKAYPIGGHTLYNSYLKSSLKYPKEAINNKIEGIVKLELSIDKKGNVADITVLESLGYGCDKEAIRLVNEGVDWKPAKDEGKKVDSSVMLSFTFKLKE